MKVVLHFRTLAFLPCLLLFTALPFGTMEAQSPFIITVKTDNPGSSNNTSFTIPTIGGGYNYAVDWDDDGIYDQSGITGNVTHDYGMVGTYTLRIRGAFPRIFFNDGGDRLKLLDVKQWGSIVWTSMGSAFRGCNNLNITATDLPDLSAVTDMSQMFEDCGKLNGPSNIGDWNTEKVTDMRNMFRRAARFNQPIGDWNTAAVTNMSNMFFEAVDFNQHIGNWNTAAVTNMSSMFNNTYKFDQPIGNWNTEKVTDMPSMFSRARAFNQPIGNWNTAAVTNMNFMFASTERFNQPIGDWNTAAVTNMSGMFFGAARFNQPIGNWNTEKVTDMRDMFQGATVFNQPIGNWTLNASVHMGSMLNNCGMTCANYSATLIGWANNPATPSGRSLGASGRQYGTNAASARNTLTTTKGWTISGDAASGTDCTPCTTVPSFANCPSSPLIAYTPASSCNAVATYTLTANGLPAPALTYAFTGATTGSGNGTGSGSAFNKGNTTVTVTATNNCTQSATCAFTVRVVDNVLPSITCPANQTRSTDPNQCQAAVTYATPTAADNCTMPSGQPLWVSGGTAPTPSGSNSISVFQKGQTTVTWRATDAAGLSKTCTFRVTVNDAQAPTFTLCPSSQSLNTDPNQCSAVATYDTPTATDNCTPPPTVVRTSGLPSGSAFPKGNNTIVWKATDGVGLTKTCSFTVTVTDAQPPSINCPMNISVTGSGSPCTAMVTYATPTATDNCGVQSLFLLSGLGSGSQFPVGMTNVVWRAIDNSGLSATCAFTVTVSCVASPNPSEGGESTATLTTSHSAIMSPPLRGGWEGPSVGLSLSPNPATAEVQILVEHFGSKTLMSGGDLTVLDAQGRTVWQRQLSPEYSGQPNNSATQQLSVADFAAGLYFVTLRSEGKTVAKRLVVSR